MKTFENSTNTRKRADRAATRLSTARSRELGEELRRVRQRAGLSSVEVAESLGWSLGKLSKLETGSRGTSVWEIGTLVGRCGADKATRDRVLALAAEVGTGSFLRLHDPHPDTLTALTIHERAARTLTAYDPFAIPALAQTRDYTHALTGDPDLARARAARSDVLYRQGRPRTVLYLHETALRLVVGGAEVMRDQLVHLVLMCGWDDVTLRLIPMTAPAHAALLRPATLLTFADPVRPMVHTETDAATVFHDDPHVVTGVQAKMRRLHTSALSHGQSHDVLVRWADTYGREAG